VYAGLSSIKSIVLALYYLRWQLQLLVVLPALEVVIEEIGIKTGLNNTRDPNCSLTKNYDRFLEHAAKHHAAITSQHTSALSSNQGHRDNGFKGYELIALLDQED
jgi:hypothetical protein